MRRLMICAALLAAGCFEAVPMSDGAFSGGAERQASTDAGSGELADGGAKSPGDGGSGQNTDAGIDAGVDGGSTCDELAAAYAAALTRARTCNPMVLVVQCTHARPRSLGCDCPTFVQNPDELDAIAKLWRAQGCSRACPEVLCQLPGGAECVQVGQPHEGECRDRP